MRKSRIRPASSSTPSAEVGRFITNDTRVDPPHLNSRAEDAAPSETPPSDAPPANETVLEVDENASEEFDPIAMETLRNQARQLSVLLHERQETLDRRDSEWQGQLATHENELRAARLWFEEHQAQLAEREKGCTARELEIELRFNDLSQAEQAIAQLRNEGDAALNAREAAAASREETVTRREAEVEDLALRTAVESAAQRGALRELEARGTELQREIDAARHENAAMDRRRAEIEAILNQPSEFQLRMQAELDDREATLDRRETDLVTQELKVRQAWVDVERLQAELRTEREHLVVQERRDRQEVAEQRRRIEEEAAEKRQSLERQSEQLDFRRAAVKQEQAELAESQREILETRLAVEELWTQLSGVVPPAVLTENLARLRGRLAEQYRLQNNELATQKAELETLRAELAAENEKLRIQTGELRRWADLRHDEIERQAAFLTAREQELEQQDKDLNRQSQAWRQERGRYEQEIRRLENELRRVGIEIAPLLRGAAV